MKYNLYISAVSCLRQECTNKAKQMTEISAFKQEKVTTWAYAMSLELSDAKTSDEITKFGQPRCIKQGICTQQLRR